MQKIYLVLLSVTVTFSAWAQKSIHHMNAATEKMKRADEIEAPVPAASTNNKAPFDVIWSQDFGSGTGVGTIPAGWTQSGVNQIWKKTFIGSTGCFGTSTYSIASATASNGSLIFDADSLNKAVTADCTGATYAALSGEVTTETIDLTGKPNVRLEFQQLFRLCCSASTTFLTVSVSGNGGATWTDYSAKGLTGINSYCPNGETISINISTVAGGSNNVKVKFKFDSGLGTYFWQIDDVKIIEGPVNDIKLENVYTDFSYEDGGYYTQTPAGQVAPITFRGAIYNGGFAAQTGVDMDVNVTGAGTYSQTSNTLSSFPLYAHDTLMVTTTPFTPSAVGTYTATYTVSQTETDELMSDNTMSRDFKVSDTIYARDKGATGAGLSNSLSPSDYVGGDVDGSLIGTLYEFPANGTITTASTFVASTAQIGTSFDFVLYNIDGTGSFVEVANSDIYAVSAASDRNKWVTMPMQSGIWPVTAGESYVIAVRQYVGSGSFDLDIANDLTMENIQPAHTSFVDPGGTGSWGWIQKAPFLRLNLEALNAGIEELSQNAVLMQNIPNPANESTAINFELKRSNEVSLSVVDVTGKLVKTINAGNLVTGMHTITLETADLDAGVYFYTLTAGGEKMTKKLTVIKK
ncbi:MAG: T9SS type A sorting domain-containing protein [Bacteroidia bacterium]